MSLFKKAIKRFSAGGFRDPSIGLECNNVNLAYGVSSDVWKFDIARTPQVCKGFGDYVDIQGEAWNANNDRRKVDKRRGRYMGRS